MNKVVRTLILSDLFIMSSFGLVQPVFAVFMITHITGATVAAVGVAGAIALFSRAVLQIWVAKWTDEERGNCRELYTLVIGSFIIACVPFGYALSTTLWHVYITQLLYGMGQALSYPSWRVIFSRYADNQRAGYAWSVYDTTVSFGVAATAAIGGYLAEAFSFRWMFVVVGIFSFVGSMFLIHIFQQEFTCRVHFKKK